MYTVTLSEVNNDVTTEVSTWVQVDSNCTITIKPDTLREDRAYIIIVEPNVGESVTYYFYTYMG